MDLTYDTLMDDGNYLGSERARAENQALLDELERKKKARAMAVPTDDTRVKLRLREIGEPITLFGERAADRRDRLIYVLSQINAARGDEGMAMEVESESESEDEEEEFYSPGSLELLEARRRIAEFSLPRAQKRVAQQRLETKIELKRLVDIRKKVFGNVKRFANLGSQIGDERPLAQIRFSPNNELLATGSWSGCVRLWRVPSCTPIRTMRGHSDRVGGVAWHPDATLSLGPDLVNLASGAGDHCVNLWSLNGDQPLAVLQGHQGRVCRVAFHPSGDYVASASFDTTWRLWDVGTQKELLLQEGHAKEAFAVEFQDDGALIASGGLDAIGRVWDMRTGRTAMVLDGHVQPIYSMSFSPNGYQIATGAGDDTIRIWDMRSLKALYTIPAHLSNVSEVRFFRANDRFFVPPSEADVPMQDADVDMKDESGGNPPNSDAKDDANGAKDAKDASKDATADATADKSTDRPDTSAYSWEEWKYRSGLFFASAGYDGLVKLWSADDWQLLRTLSTDAGKVMSCDINSDGSMIASGTYNRNFQLYGMEDAV
ncbi:WD40-repeat-containing domain protein [Schizophyllum amplum]|uniref:WD40-repeat-containing domain protein n=1 Tax=Schizophyllum amplum TaxID=97359 RepID=A0A550BZJ7_9AGAR|nr:WD40-repeat-containing domain protein [Auriculariopsis ampla]